uniref:organic cation/carnitine transporter 7-like isoform X2 n=1 Tax=Erigeron canadensis TaxID=72917 RepID=UPI001CB9327B|nr:organic cation/carnitine transporter 7-like isoform X2 [Erigeron canadensis]
MSTRDTHSHSKMGDHGYEYTLDEALATIGFGKLQVIVLAYSGLGWVAEAMEMMLLSFVGPAIRPEWGLTSNQESYISTVAFFGMLVGAYLWGVVSDTYGRKKGFLGSTILTSIAGLLGAFAPNYITLLILRCFVGIGLGCGHVFTSWFLEFLPTTNRGAWMVVFSTFWTVGTIMEASLAWWIMPTYGWRWLLGLSIFPSLVALLFYNFVPESPRYLCTQGRLMEAHRILEYGAALNNTSLPVGLLVCDQTNDMLNEGESSESTALLSSITNKTNDTQRSSSSILMLFSPKLARTTLLLWFLYFGNTFAYYAIILLTSQLSLGQSECYLTTLLSESENIKDPSLYTNVFITSLAELPGLGLAALILDRVGRKISMEIMIVSGFVLLFPLVVHQNAIMTTFFLFGARMFISASFIIVCIYTPEVYPTNLRTTGVGIATGIGRIGGMVCPLIAVGMGSGCHQTLPVILFEVVILLSGVAVILLPFETKGRELADSVDVPVQHVLVV